MRTVAFCEIDDSAAVCSPSTGPKSPATLMFESFQETGSAQRALDQISSAEGSPAKTFLGPESAPGLPGSVRDCTGNLCEPFAWFDRSTQSWRTWQRCLVTGWDVVLGDMAESRFDAEWDCVPACAIGACHERDRIWIITHAVSERCGEARQSRHRSIQVSPGELRRGLPTPRLDIGWRISGGRGDLLTVLRGYETKHAGTLPTPQARDWKDGRYPNAHGGHSPSLPVVISGHGRFAGRMNPPFREG